MNRLQWEWQRWTQHLNYMGLTLFFLVGLVLVLEALGIAPRTTLIQQRSAELDHLSAALGQAQRQHLDSTAQPAALPLLAELTKELATLHKLAQSQGVTLEKVDYQLSREGTAYWRYQLKSEGKFTYPAVRHFLDKALAQLPNLALDNLEIDRESADNGIPSVKLGLSLYFAGNSAGEVKR